MKTKPYIFRSTKKFKSLKIWISGAVPEREYWKHSLIDQDIIEFIAHLSAIVFAKGGTIVHGCHPVFTPVIVGQAKRFATKKHQLKLYVSDLWGTSEFEKYTNIADLICVPSHKNSRNEVDKESRNKSLTDLRKKMASESNCIISIAGKFHLTTGFVPGVVEELDIANEMEIPSYVLGMFGGVSESDGYHRFRNKFLTQNEKELIFTHETINFLPSMIIKLIERDRQKIVFNSFMKKFLRK